MDDNEDKIDNFKGWIKKVKEEDTPEPPNIDWDEIENNDNPLLSYQTFIEYSLLFTHKSDKEEIYRDGYLLYRKLPKLFISDKKFDYIFRNTTPPAVNEELKLPFDFMFISTKFKVNIDDNDFFLCGLLLSSINKESFITDNVSTPIQNNFCKCSTFFFDKKREGTFYLPILLDLTNGKIENNYSQKIEYKLAKILAEYVINMLLFLNEPRVVTYIVSPNNKRREKKGLIPIPSLLMTKITPELKEYINVNYQSHSKLGFMFDVRGHYRILRDINRYKENVGKKIWIAPYVRGEGMKPPQIFKICEK